MISVPSGLNVCWKWDDINRIGQTKSLQSSYWFLAVVPTLAKLLHHIAPDGKLALFGAQTPVQLGLPFSWVALFFCALFVSLGNAVYTIKCPRLIKSFADYFAFQTSARNSLFLMESLTILRPAKERSGDIDAVIDAVVQSLSKVPESELLANARYQLKQHGLPGSDSFYFVRDASNEAYPVWRCIASISYAVGFALLGWLFIQNVWAVMSYLGGRSL